VHRARRSKARAARVPRPHDYQPWRISGKDSKELLAKAGQRQIIARTQHFDGKIASGRLDARWAADMISYVAQPAKVGGETMEFVLIVQYIFSREIWTRALPNIKAERVAQAYIQRDPA
jgi:hypothetical protein